MLTNEEVLDRLGEKRTLLATILIKQWKKRWIGHIFVRSILTEGLGVAFFAIGLAKYPYTLAKYPYRLPLLRHEGLLKDVIEGLMEGKIQSGRKRMMISDDTKNGRSYSSMKKDTENRESWRNSTRGICVVAEHQIMININLQRI